MSKEDNSQLKILRYINLSVIVSGSIGDVTGSDGLLGGGTLSFSANIFTYSLSDGTSTTHNASDLYKQRLPLDQGALPPVTCLLAVRARPPDLQCVVPKSILFCAPPPPRFGIRNIHKGDDHTVYFVL